MLNVNVLFANTAVSFCHYENSNLDKAEWISKELLNNITSFCQIQELAINYIFPKDIVPAELLETIVSMLLWEAHKLCVDAILNLRIDSNTTYTQTTTSDSVSTGTSSGRKSSVVTTKTITYTGGALAIKYRNE